MDKQTLVAILNQHITGTKLDLPVDALQSDSITGQFALFLPDENLILDPITNRQDDGDSHIITGTGQNTLFQGTTVTARFTAADSAQLLLTAQTQSGWTPASAFPNLQQTLASDLQFKDAHWQLAAEADEAAGNGLSFQGTMDTASSLGLFVFLLGNTDEVFSGNVDSVKDGVPSMRLAGAVRGATDLSFIALGAINLALVTQALPPVRSGGETQAGVVLEISTSLDFKAKGKTLEIPLTAGIYNTGSPIRFDADTSQIISAGLSDLSALLNSVDLSNLSFGDFRLEDYVTLSELTLVADPSADPKLQSVALTVDSTKTWNLLTYADGSPLVALQNIQATLGSGAPFTADDFSASLHGEIILGDSRIVMNTLMSPELVVVEGVLDSSSHLSLGDIARHFLGETEPHTPELILNHLEFTVQPGQSYKLTSEVDDLWTLDLVGDKTLDVKSLAVDWEYTTGGSVNAVINGAVQIAGADIGVEAKYDTANGWDFSGALAVGETVAIGDLLTDLLYYFDAAPPPFVETIKLNQLAVDFNTTSKHFDFTLGGGFPLDDKWLEIVLKIQILNNNDEFTFDLSGTLTIGDFEFDLAFLHASADNRFIAAYSHTGAPLSLPLQSFVADSLSSTVAEFVPADLNIDIKDILFAFDSTTAQTKFVFALDIGTDINLSNLPLVGQELPSAQTVSVDDLRVLVASKALDQTEVVALNEIVPANVTKLPATADDNSTNQANGNGQFATASTPETVIPQGLTVSAQINFGGEQETLSLTTGGTPPPPAANNNLLVSLTPAEVSTPAAASPSGDDVHWFTVQKTFGPVQFERIGVQYKNAVLTFLLDAALTAAGLTISLEGLSVGSPLAEFSPQFNLDGLGIDYQNGSVEIGAAFLRDPSSGEYDGTAVVKTAQFSLSAIGSYAKVDGHPSLFIYGILDYPIGGPAFFFVTGLAAGFGYNRALNVPPISDLAAFPMIAEAADPSGGGVDLGAEMTKLKTYIPPTQGEVFLAAGVKFTSFKMIDSFALLVFSFGTTFEIDVLGLSTLIVPTPIEGESVTPLAEAQMALRASFVPAEGFLGVSAQLTPASYILSKDCHLTGGYAFYSWFSGAHEGDFVQTLGGYHPSFNVPAHYPQVPRLGFDWQIDDHISLKGELYYALTPSALMAGGFLQALWEDGDLSAWFKAGADFLISWKPYHYDAEIYVDMGVSYSFSFFGRHTINVDIGADVHIWGPEFAGHAHIHLWIVSFDVSFGSSSSNAPQPIVWNQFREAFLPASDADICSIIVQSGLVKGTQDKTRLGIINSKQLSIVTNSVIPSTEATIGTDSPDNDAPVGEIAPIGIGSMAVAPGGAFVSKHNITITRDSQPAENDFKCVPIKKNVPAGLWGRNLLPDINGQAVIEDALTGFEITPKALPTPGETLPVERSVLLYSNPMTFVGAFGFENSDTFKAEPAEDDQRRQEIKDTITSDGVANARNQLLQSLGVGAEIDLSGNISDTFIIPPAIQAD